MLFNKNDKNQIGEAIAIDCNIANKDPEAMEPP